MVHPSSPSLPSDGQPPEAAPTVFPSVGVTPTTFGRPAPQPLQIEVSPTVDGTATVTVIGELLQETARVLTDGVADLAGDPSVTTLVVDLRRTAFMDSTGLGTLVTLRAELMTRGGRLLLVRPADRVFRLFELTRLDSVFVVVDDLPSTPADAASH